MTTATMPYAPLDAHTPACLGIPADVFFPSSAGNDSDPRLELAAKNICGRCPLQERCLERELDAMRGGAMSTGIFGGTNEAERRKMLRWTFAELWASLDFTVVKLLRAEALAESRRLRDEWRTEMAREVA